MKKNKFLYGSHLMLHASEKGQVLLIVVLIMVIALTVGLALVSRSVINLKSTNEEQDSQRAFQAAEAGVEIGLQKPIQSQDITISQKTLDNSAVINSVTIHTISGSTILLNNGNPVAQDEGIDAWLTQYPNYTGTPWGPGTINIYWGSANGCNDAAIEVVVLSGISPTDPGLTLQRYGIDPCGSDSVDKSKNRDGDNKFSPAVSATADGPIGGKVFKFKTAISVTNGIVMKIVPLYTNSPMAIVGDDNTNKPLDFPAQGRIIYSKGSYASTQRQVSFFQGFPLLPVEFFYGLFQK